jgi:Lung seven transmembrane receptor
VRKPPFASFLKIKMLFFLIAGQVASQVFMEYEFGSMMLCDALWGKHSVPFPRQEPSIEVKITPYSSHGSLTLALFRFEDRRHFESNPIFHNYQICVPNAISSGKCRPEDLNRFIISNETKSSFLGPVLNEAVHWHEYKLEKRQVNGTENSTTTTTTTLPSTTEIPDIHNNPVSKTSYSYQVQDTGLYCVLSVRDSQEYLQDYSVSMIAHNAYGLLPAIFFPTLPFFATQLAAYILIGFVWAFTSILNRRELLPIQNLVGGMIGFLIIENIVNLAFFADFNNHGYICKLFNLFVAKPLLGLMVALNAGRNSLSFFILLVVCLGYGVVYPTLGRSMYYAIGLTAVHFVFGALYLTSSMVAKDVNSFVVFLLGLPLAVSLFVFYCWILIGASQTIKYLESKRQSIKLKMYRRNIFNNLRALRYLDCISNAIDGDLGFKFN